MAELERGVEREMDVVCVHKPPRDRAESRISYATYDFGKRKRVRTAARKGSGLTMNERTDVRKNAGDDVIIFDRSRRGVKIREIVNIYD